MNKIGITMRYGLFVSKAAGPGETAMLEAYGGVEMMMEAYARMGVASVELSAVHTHRPMDEMLAICKKIMDSGLHLTLHGTTENMPGKAHFDFFAPLYDEIFKRQQDLTVTLHAPNDLDLAVSILADWCKEGMDRYPQLLFVQENQRVRLPEHKEHFRINAIPPTLPKTENIGICWDMGHYAYNVIKAGLPAETLPASETVKLIRHTHIHGIENMDTHFPLRDEPVITYVKALKRQGYQGLYNLELVPGKFMEAYPDVKGETEGSILRLQEMLKQ